MRRVRGGGIEMDQRVVNGSAAGVSWWMTVGGAPEKQRACEVCGATSTPGGNLCTWCAQLAKAAVEEL
jgi:hypothetical protein